jgi:hypothetical protein
MEGLLKNLSGLLFVVPRTSSRFFLGAGLAQALGGAAGIIQSIGLVAVFGGLIGAAVSALSGRELSGVKTSLVIAAVGGLAWLIATAFFTAGGMNANITPQAIN